MYLVGFCAKTYKWKLSDILEAPLEFTLDMISVYSKVTAWQWKHKDEGTEEEDSIPTVSMDQVGL